MEPALRWAAAQVTEAEGRKPVGVEMRGELAVDGIALHGKADRIDRDGEGRLAIVDYKSGGAPSAKAAFDRLDNQLGLLGLIAQGGGIEGVAAAPVAALEYWSLRPDRRADGAGKITRNHGPRSGLNDRKSTRLNSSH